MSEKESIVTFQPFNSIISIIVGLFFAYTLERLFNIHQLIISLNYHIGKETLEETEFLIDLIKKSSILSSYFLIALFFVLISFLILLINMDYGKLYSIKVNNRNYLEKRRLFYVLSYLCIFIWIFSCLTFFIASIRNFNIIIYPVEKLPVEIEKEVTNVILNLLSYIMYIKSTLSNLLYLVITVFIYSLFIYFYPPKNEHKRVCFLLVIITSSCVIVNTYLTYISPNPALLGKYVVAPAGPEPFIGPPIPQYYMFFIQTLFFVYIIIFLYAIIRDFCRQAPQIRSPPKR